MSSRFLLSSSHRADCRLAASTASAATALATFAEAWVYAHNGPIRRRKHGYILTTDQADAGSMAETEMGENQEGNNCIFNGISSSLLDHDVSALTKAL
eukprot:1193426-Prorocentrum_minimum.AAC.1